MALTEEQIVELAAVKVQKEVLTKVEAFTDGVSQNVHNLQLELKDTNQFNSAVMAQLNEVKGDVRKLEPAVLKVEELHTLFCKNGYMQRFNKLSDAVDDFLKHRLETCPISKDIVKVKERLNNVEDRPGLRAIKAWDKLKWVILGAFVTAVAGGVTAFLLGLI